MSNNPWDIRTDDTRSQDTIGVFVIYCEDAVSEVSYFNSYASDDLIVTARGNKRGGKLNLGDTVKDCLQAGYMEFSEDGYRRKNMITENLWCVYDRDFENRDPGQIRPDDNLQWDLAIQTAQNAGLKVAWSNDAFEIWVLLHFEEVKPGDLQHRDYIYDRLTEVFKGLESDIPNFNAFVSHEKFNYKGALKRTSTFTEFVLPLLKPRTAIALERAQVLAGSYAGTTAFHQRNPCTQVHLLVNDLLASGGTS